LGKINVEHGAGGRETWELIKRLIVSRVPEGLRRVEGGYGLDALDDGAVIRFGDRYLVVATDSFTVNPPIFPGGDIGHLAACGAINDVVMMGAKPVALMDAVVVEEGVDEGFLQRILNSLISVLEGEGVALIGGDFKVMPRGTVDKVVITATGLGVSEGEPIVDKVRPGDKIVVSGPVGEHGAAVLAAQLGMAEDLPKIRSDSKPLTKTVLPVLNAFKKSIHAARDPTRGGLAATLNEWVDGTDLTIVIRRAEVPVRAEVREFLDAMGVDPLNLACEGVAVLAVSPDVANDVVGELRRAGETHATIIGEVMEPSTTLLSGRVVAVTEVGGKVLLEPRPVNLPRIC